MSPNWLTAGAAQYRHHRGREAGRQSHRPDRLSLSLLREGLEKLRYEEVLKELGSVWTLADCGLELPSKAGNKNNDGLSDKKAAFDRWKMGASLRDIDLC